jgi:predicted small lipoprotein YifL
MSRGTLAVLTIGTLLLVACGQKGALYLPDRNAQVVTRPAQPAAASPQGQGAAQPAAPSPQSAGGQPDQSPQATGPDQRKKNEGDATSSSPTKP